MGRASLLLVFLLLLSSAMACECSSFVQKSRAGFLSSLPALSAGACRYGSMAVSLNAGFVAAASSAVILSDGVRCGACLQVRCTKRRICGSEGAKVILTDLSRSIETGLVLSRAGFAAMARHGMAKELIKLRRVDVEYKRIPCEYNKNMAIRVEEKSQWPSNLAIKFLYQGGQTDIVAVDIAEVGSANWGFMSRDYGPVWSTNRAPSGPLQLRMVVTGGYDGRHANYLHCRPTNKNDKLLIYVEETTRIHLFGTLAACEVTESTLALSKCEQWPNFVHSD